MVDKNEENTRNINAQFGNMSSQLSNIIEMLSRMSLPHTNNTNTNQASRSSNSPSQLLTNPKGSINTITLRTGTTLEEVEPKPIKLAEDVPKVEVGETMEIDEDEKEEEVVKEEEEQLRAKEPKRKSNLEEQIPIPFPTLAKKAKKHEELDPNIVQIFKNVEYSDPGPCLVSCMIGEIQLKDFMCNFGSCVSIMPLSIYEKLRRSGARFVLADKSIISVVDRPSSILLGRQFLKTSRFKLDAFSGDYSFEAKGKVVKFKLEVTMRQTLEVHSIFGCDIFEDDVIEEHFGSDDEISVSRNLGRRGVSKEKGKDPRLPYPQGNKAPNHGAIDKWKHLPLKDTLTKANKKDKMDVVEDVPKR
ncbi:hypothetical protein AHAS_Ahas17G0205000 [Arachis hypogaea]